MQATATVTTSYRRLILIALAVPLAIWGQWALLTQKLVLDAIILFASASALFVLLVLRGEQPELLTEGAAQAGAGEKPWRGFRRLPLLLAAASAVLAWAFSGGDRFRPETVLFWVLACSLFTYAFWEKHPSSRRSMLDRLRTVARSGINLSWPAIVLILIVLLGAFFRYYQIDRVPAEAISDHAEKLLDVKDLMDGQYRIFFPRNTGREPLQFYMAVPFAAWLGLTFLALKALTAAVSLGTVPLVYLIGKELGGAKYGLIAAFFIAVSKWDIAIGRFGLRFPYYPFFAALAFLFLLRALRHGRRNDYLLAGLATGIGLYGYSPARAVLLLIAVLVLIKVALDARAGWRAALPTAWNGLLSVGVALVTMIPLGHYMVENPQMFWLRALTRVSGQESPLPADVGRVLLSNFTNAMLMFNWRGDEVWTTTISLDPVLDYVSGGLFVLGAVYMLYSAIWKRQVIASYLLVSMVVLMLPSILSIAFPNENPGIARTGGAGPIVALIIAAPIYLIARSLILSWPSRAATVVVVALLGIVLGLTARVSYDRYFIDYAKQYEQAARNSSEIAASITGYARSIGSFESAYVKAYPHWVDTRNVAFNIRQPGWNNVLSTPEDIARHNAPAGNKLYVLNKLDTDGLRQLQQRFPEGQAREQPSAAPGHEFLLFFVPGR